MKRQWTPQEKRKLVILWTIFGVCLVGFILSLIMVITHNPHKTGNRLIETYPDTTVSQTFGSNDQSADLINQLF